MAGVQEGKVKKGRHIWIGKEKNQYGRGEIKGRKKNRNRYISLREYCLRVKREEKKRRSKERTDGIPKQIDKITVKRKKKLERESLEIPN